MPTFDGKKMVGSFGPVTLGDYGADDSVEVNRDGPDFELVQGASGYTEFCNKNSNIHTITFTVMQTSLINQQLSEILESDRLNNDGEHPFSLKDAGPNGTTDISFDAARIVSPAPAAYGSSTKERKWTLMAGSPSKYIVGGN